MANELELANGVWFGLEGIGIGVLHDSNGHHQGNPPGGSGEECTPEEFR